MGNLNKKLLTEQEWEEIAKENIDLHLADVVEEELDPEATEEDRAAHKVRVQEEAYVLAHDAMISKGCGEATASRIAKSVSLEYGV